MTIYLNQFCVYSHAIEGTIFYIGKGRGYRAFEAARRNERWSEAVRDQVAFEVSVLGWFESDDEARKFEAAQIHKFKPAANMMHNGLTRTVLHRAAISNATKGIKKSDVTRAKMSAARMGMPSWNKGKHMSEEQKKVLSAQATGRIAITETGSGKVFGSVREAVRLLEIPKTTLLQHLCGNLKHVRGMIFTRTIS